MAVTVGDVALALRLIATADADLDAGNTAILTRLLGTAEALVDVFADVAPDAVKDEATVRLASYLYDVSPGQGRRDAYANGLVNSGAGSLLSFWHDPTGGGMAAAAQAGIDTAAVNALIATAILSHAGMPNVHHTPPQITGDGNVDLSAYATVAALEQAVGGTNRRFSGAVADDAHHELSVNLANDVATFDDILDGRNLYVDASLHLSEGEGRLEVHLGSDKIGEVLGLDANDNAIGRVRLPVPRNDEGGYDSIAITARFTASDDSILSGFRLDVFAPPLDADETAIAARDRLAFTARQLAPIRRQLRDLISIDGAETFATATDADAGLAFATDLSIPNTGFVKSITAIPAVPAALYANIPTDHRLGDYRIAWRFRDFTEYTSGATFRPAAEPSNDVHTYQASLDFGGREQPPPDLQSVTLEYHGYRVVSKYQGELGDGIVGMDALSDAVKMALSGGGGGGGDGNVDLTDYRTATQIAALISNAVSTHAGLPNAHHAAAIANGSVVLASLAAAVQARLLPTGGTNGQILGRSGGNPVWQAAPAGGGGFTAIPPRTSVSSFNANRWTNFGPRQDAIPLDAKMMLIRLAGNLFMIDPQEIRAESSTATRATDGVSTVPVSTSRSLRVGIDTASRRSLRFYPNFSGGNTAEVAEFLVL